MPQNGDPHPDNPGCVWSSTLNNYACDDGFTIDGQPLPAGFTPAEITSGAGISGVREVGPVTLADLSALIESGGGHYDTAANDPLVAQAKSQWWKFNVAISTNGQTARISENHYLFYGGLAIAAIVLAATFFKE